MLITLLSEISMHAKNDGNRSPTDEDCVKIIQKFIKSIIETKRFLEEARFDVTKQNYE